MDQKILEKYSSFDYKFIQYKLLFEQIKGVWDKNKK